VCGHVQGSPKPLLNRKIQKWPSPNPKKIDFQENFDYHWRQGGVARKSLALNPGAILQDLTFPCHGPESLQIFGCTGWERRERQGLGALVLFPLKTL